MQRICECNKLNEYILFFLFIFSLNTALGKTMAMKMTTEIQATIFLLSICPFLVFGDGVTSGG